MHSTTVPWLAIAPATITGSVRGDLARHGVNDMSWPDYRAAILRSMPAGIESHNDDLDRFLVEGGVFHDRRDAIAAIREALDIPVHWALDPYLNGDSSQVPF